MVIRKLKARYSKWKIWRKYTWLSKRDQYLILLGLKRSYHFQNFKV